MTYKRSQGLHTRLVHGGEYPGCSVPPIFQANTVDSGYARFANPTIAALEAKFVEFEGGARTLATASGMAAVTVAVLGIARAGGHILAHRSGFIGTDSLFSKLLPRWGIEVRRVDMRALDALERELEREPALVYFEVLSNPAMELLDAPEVLARARARGIPTVVDNTLLTPIGFRPLEHGADVVLHSASKYIGGHGDALGGLVTTATAELGDALADVRRLTGSIMSPLNAFLISRGLITLPDRMRRHAANARVVAEFLCSRPEVTQVHYVGLESWPEHELATRILDSFGGVFSVELASTHAPAKVAQALNLCRSWYSFGDVATLVRAEDRAPDRLRVSIGLEDPEDLIVDLGRALDQAGS